MTRIRLRRTDRNIDLHKLVSELTVNEQERLETMTTAQASHCTPMSCNITGCAVLCDSMSCPDFEYACGPNCNLMGGCAGQLRCRGFTGTGDNCKAFVTVPA